MIINYLNALRGDIAIMRYFYIDTENRNLSTWVNTLRRLKKTDTVYIIHTQNSAKLPVEASEMFISSPASFVYYEALSGHANSLDFALVAILSERIQTASKSEHYIISADKGYESAVDYLRHKCPTIWISHSLALALRNNVETNKDITILQ